jgi:hypothetical protein
MVMKPYTLDGLKLMKVLDDFKENEVITEGDYWNVIACKVERPQGVPSIGEMQSDEPLLVSFGIDPVAVLFANVSSVLQLPPNDCFWATSLFTRMAIPTTT